MSECKCPKCGHKQPIAKSKTDAKTQLFMGFFKEHLNCNFIHIVECKKCGINYEQENNLGEK
jgi:hypothetical protein